MPKPVFKHFKILVADDDKAALAVFRQTLSCVKTDQLAQSGEEKLKFDLVFCQQGDEAVRAVKSSLKKGCPFSVAFIDVRIPSCSRYSFNALET